MSKTQKKFVQQDFPSQSLLSEKEIRRGFKYTDIGTVEVTGTMLGRTKIRKIHPQYQTKLRWLIWVIFLLIIAAAIGFTTHIRQQLAPLSTPAIKAVALPLSRSTVELTPDAAARGQPAKIDTIKIDPVKINQVKAERIENGVAAKVAKVAKVGEAGEAGEAGEVKASQMNAGEVKNPSVLQPPIVLPSDIEVHVPSANALQNKEGVAPVKQVDEPAPMLATQPDEDSEEPPSE